jgi:RNA polymerase sigma-70 factor (sigma-E family)
MEPGGDPFASFESWAAARQHGLLRSAFLITGDIHRAEDLVQDALFKMAFRWDRLGGGSPDAYVRTIVYRTHVSWWRARRETPVANVQDTARQVDDAELPLIVQDALARLTAKQRAVLVLRYFDDLTETETALVLGVSVGSVKKQAAVAKQRLREVAPELKNLADLRDDTP